MLNLISYNWNLKPIGNFPQRQLESWAMHIRLPRKSMNENRFSSPEDAIGTRNKKDQ